MTDTGEPRDQKLTVMLTRSEMLMLRQVAELDGVKMSDIVRQAIRAKHARVVQKAKKELAR